MPTPPNFRELAHSSALAARTNKVDSNDRTLLKCNILSARTLRMFIENKNPAKDFSSLDRCVRPSVVVVLVVNGSLDLAARAIVLQAFLFNLAIQDAATEFRCAGQMNRARGARVLER
jgi:hypothetical protein